MDSRGIPGWNHVDKLARALVELHGLCVCDSAAEKIKELYHNLLEFDKRPPFFPTPSGHHTSRSLWEKEATLLCRGRAHETV